MTVVERVEYSVVSNNADMDATPNWISGNNYVYGDRVNYQGAIYLCGVGNDSTTPPNENIKCWVFGGNPNQNKFQDKFINTQTAKANGDLEIVINIRKGFANGFAFFNTDAKRILIYDSLDRLIWEKALTIRDEVFTWWQYFYGDGFTYRNDAWFLPDLEYSGNIKFVLEPNEKGANLGHLIVGKKVFLGYTLMEPSVSILDYSKKIIDDWGNIHIRSGKAAKYSDVALVMRTDTFDTVRKRLEKNRGLTLFVGDEREDGFESLTIFGHYKDLEMVIPNTEYSEANLSIEGVI